MSEMLELICDALEPLGPVTARRMFGGHGLFIDGLMFGLVAGDVLYLKVDSINWPHYEAADLPRFTYQRQGKTIALSYAEAPAECLEDSEVALSWAGAALAAAMRNRKPNSSKVR